MKYSKGKRIGAWMLSILMAAGISPVQSDLALAAETKETAAATTGTADSSYSVERLTQNYTHISAGYTAPLYEGETVRLSSAEALKSAAGLKAEDDKGYGAEVAKLSVGDEITYTVNVPETARYVIGFDYCSYDESILPIKLGFKLDGDYPFYEARTLLFETSWVNSDEDNIDRYGNEIVKMPEKLVQWEHKALMDSSYRYSTPLLLELTKGLHTFTIDAAEGNFLLGDLTLEKQEQIKEGDASSTGKAAGNALITIEGEDIYLRNDSSIHAASEYDGSLWPLSATTTVLNILDQDSFDTPGQTVTYKFTVETEGDYYIGMNYRQGERNGFPVFIDYAIDGKIPNSYFKSYAMPYTTDFKKTTLAVNKQKLTVHLTPGEHTISATINVDEIRYALEQVDEIMNGINDLSLDVTKVAGTNKDKNRDLRLTRYIPDVKTRLQGWVDQLYAIADQAKSYVGAKKAKDVAAFAYLIIAAKQLQTLADEPDELIYRVAELSTSTNSVNTQIANFVDLIGRNNISFDRIYIYQDGAKLPGKQNFFASIGMAIKRFFYSFFGQSYSASNTNKAHLQVWVNRPRQYVEIMQKMADSSFTREFGIEVDLSLMTDANKLVLSNASGDTPDIATGINYSIPFELGIRGALVDLTKFSNYKEVFGRYSEGLLVPSVIGDQLISLPETMNFYVMFYRTDILEKLGLTPPDTMEELVGMLPDLQMRGLNVFYPTAPMTAMRNFHGTTPLIFQNNGRLYGRTALDILVDEEEAVEGFTQLTELFTLYNMPVDVPNFYQHFRNGDLCIGIADFNAYNLITNAAPEIANSWKIALVPGVKDESTGEVVRYMSGGAESTVMFASDDEREQQAWNFMDWWSRAETQAEFGQMLQIMYGDEYIWPTANLEAFEQLPFVSVDKAIIMEQASQILEAPRLLGSYMMEREMSNAFNDVVVNGETLRSRVDEVVKIVKRETLRKLEEFGYIDSDGNVLKEYLVPDVDQVKRILSK